MKSPPISIAREGLRAPRELSRIGPVAHRAGPRLDAADAGRVERRSIDGLRWTLRADFGRTLDGLPAPTWTDPAARGWELVKQNASRAVWRARIDERVYYLKYYGDQGWVTAFKRRLRGPECAVEFQSGLYALAAGIRAARPVGYVEGVKCADQTKALLVTEAVAPAYPLSEYWEALRADNDAVRRRRDIADLIDLLAEMIAHAHQWGFRHHDMHAANILVHAVAPGEYETVFVDLQGVRQGASLSDRAVVRNLAQLNQWFRRHASLGDRLRFLRRYLRWRNEYGQLCEHSRPLGMTFEQLVRALVGTAERHAQRLWAKRDRRAGRSNRYFAPIAVAGGWRGHVFLSCKRPTEESRASSMVLERGWWRAQLDNPLRWFVAGGAQPCKDSHSAQVSRVVFSTGSAELPAIVKRPLARNRWRRWRQLFGASRSARGWRTGNALLNREIATARPLAVLERRVGPLVFDSVLLTEAIPGAVDLETYLRREFEARARASWRRHKRELGELLVQHVRRLADCGFVHRDCKAQNLLVVSQPRLKLLWIDMDGLKRRGRTTRAAELRALTRLHVSLLEVPGLTRTDRVRFLKAYLARFGSDSRAWRRVWFEAARAVARKLNQRQIRRKWKLKRYGRV